MVFQRKSFTYGVIIGASTYAILKWYFEKRRKKNIPFDGDDDCLLFAPTLNNLLCSLSTSYCNKFYCSSCNYKKFLALISDARFSLDICVYLITSDEIAEIIFKLFMRGIYIRIVMDRQMSLESRKSKMFFFMKNHIPIKVIEGIGEELMHNKFVIIDQQKLITGSFNWTLHGFRGNFENGIVTQNKMIVQKYYVYYEFMWNMVGKPPVTS